MFNRMKIYRKSIVKTKGWGNAPLSKWSSIKIYAWYYTFKRSV